MERIRHLERSQAFRPLHWKRSAFQLLVLPVLVLAFAAPLRAQRTWQPDTTRQATPQHVEISAPREPELPTLDPKSAIVVPASRLREETGATVLSDALRAISSSFDIRRYGSLGAIALPSYRGLPAEYTTVYRDGVPVTPEQNSLTDLGQLSLRGVSRIELIPASTAVLLGGEAVGAALNVVSKVSDSSLVRVGTEQTTYASGSGWPESSYYTSAWGRPLEDLWLAGYGSIDESSGRYPFYDPSAQRYVDRTHNDAHLYSFGGNGLWSFENDSYLRFFGNYFDVDRNLPGPATVSGEGASTLTQNQSDAQGLLGARFDRSFGDWRSTISASYQNQLETFTDQAYGTRDTSRDLILELSGETHSALSPIFTLYSGVDLTHTRLAGTTNVHDGDSIISRERANLFVAGRIEPIERVTAALGLHGTYISDLASFSLQPQLVLDYRASSSLMLGAALSRSYHAPTLNELYWKGFGSDSVRPERATNWQASVRFEPERVQASLSATYFRSDLEDQVVWQPVRGILHPLNVKRSRIEGFELRAEGILPLWKRWTVSVDESYTLLSALDRTPGPTFNSELIYTSPTSSLFILSLHREYWGALTLLSRYRGHKYTDAGDLEETKLPPVTTFDLTLMTDPIRLPYGQTSLSATVQNLTNEQYAEERGYPMPGRAYRLALEFQF